MASHLGCAQPFAVLGASTVTQTLTGFSTINGNLGVSPGLLAAITNQGQITLTGSIHAGPLSLAGDAQGCALNAFTTLNLLPVPPGAPPAGNVLTGLDLGGMTLQPGVYSFASDAGLTGDLVLNMLGNPNALFVFQIPGTLTTASNSTVSVINGGAFGEVYWLVGTSATLGTGTVFQGNIIASASISLLTSAKILCGRAIALNAAVTMDGNTVSNNCAEGGDFGTDNEDFGSLGFSGGSATVIPEPGTISLMALGLVGLAGAGYWRRRKV